VTRPPATGGRGLLHGAYRLIVRGLPEGFHAKHGGDLVDCHVDAWRAEALGRGPIPRLAFWVRAFASILRTVVAQRWRASRRDRGAGWNGWMQDLRYAVRQSVRRPIFTIVAASSLAIGVGANSTIFNAVNVLLLRPVPGVVGPERVADLGRTMDGRGWDTFAYPDYEDWKASVDAFESAAAFDYGTFSFSAGAEGERITGLHVSPAYFDVMGLIPALGRHFTAEEDAPGSVPRAVVLSHAFWRNRLGADSTILGRTIHLNREAFTVVGVGPAGFRGHELAFSPSVFLPMRARPLMNDGRDYFDDRGSNWHRAVARLRPDATVELAERQIGAVYARLAEEYPTTNARRGARVEPLGGVPTFLRGGLIRFLAILTALVGLILVVTCVNVAGMFLARASSREKEIAVRLAMGSSRGRLVRQLLIEALVVFSVGGLFGCVVGAWLMGVVPIDALPLPIDLDIDLAPDPVVFAQGAAVTLVVGLLFGLVPALGATRIGVARSLKEEGGRRAGYAVQLQRVFVAGQVGLTMVLLVAAGLFLRSLQEASEVEIGFDPRGAYVTGLDLSLEGYGNPEDGRSLQAALVERLGRLPGVTHVSLSDDLPLDLGSNGGVAYPEGWAADERLVADFNVVSPEYFGALRIPILEGRSFSTEDDADSDAVVIVSRRFADEAWPGEAAVGKRLRWRDPESASRTVVAVAGDVKNQTLTETGRVFVYLPLGQVYQPATQVVVRASGGLAALAPGIRAAILDVDPSLSLTPVSSLELYTGLGILPQRLAAGITTILGALALLLAGVGVYGVVALTVTRRTKEIGVRLALGADRDALLAMIVRGGLRLVLPGLVLGAAVGIGLGYVMRAFLLEVSPVDPTTLLVAALTLVGAVAFASAAPARRASSVDPTVALRAE